MSDTANTTANTPNPDEYDPWTEGDAAPPPDGQGSEQDDYDMIDALFDGVEVTESGERLVVRAQGEVYANPLTVGLQDQMWIPVQLGSVRVEKTHTPRMSSKVCLALETGEDGKVKTFVLYDQVEDALKRGAREVIQERPLPYFVAEATHVAPRFGQRRWPYDIEVPAFAYKTALFKPRNNSTGYENATGRTLLVSSGVTVKGDRVTLDILTAKAGEMEGRIVMAQVSVKPSNKARFRDVFDDSGETIDVLVDRESGAPVTVFKAEPQAGGDEAEPQAGDEAEVYMFNDASGRIYDGKVDLLFPIKNEENTFAIRDGGESSAPLQEKYYQVNDYLKPPFLPVPNRDVDLRLLDGTTAHGEITWDTIGAIARDLTPGVHVDILVMDGSAMGKTVPAVWLSRWSQVPDSSAEGDTVGAADDDGETSLDKALASL